MINFGIKILYNIGECYTLQILDIEKFYKVHNIISKDILILENSDKITLNQKYINLLIKEDRKRKLKKVQDYDI